MNRYIVITGATAGIGEACAHAFAQNGDNLILVGRRKERIEKLRDELISTHDIKAHAISLDVRDKDAVFAAIESLPEELKKIDILINNAGLAVGLDPIQDGNVDDWERMIDTNIKGLLYMSRAITPLMQKTGHGHIINIGSIAGREAYPKGNVYVATKHAVDGLTKGMRIDLMPAGIKVSQVAPGAVETEFSIVRFKGDEERANKVYKGYEALNAEDVAEAVLFVANSPAHVNVNDILIMPFAQANATTFHKK